MQPLTAPKSQRILPPQGTHVSRCVRLIHLGDIVTNFKGEEKVSNKIELLFELSDETAVFKQGEDPKPFVISKEFTLSMAEKANLRKFIEGMIGTSLTQSEADSFDVTSLVGKACLIAVKHRTSQAGNVRAEIMSASPLIRGQVAREPFNQPKILTYANWDQELFDSLPQFVKEKIVSSVQYREKFGKPASDDGEAF